jgi:DNA-binding NarL/FixJ family response regulator
VTAASGPACILCIEDELTLLADLQEELSAAGYRVLAASSAPQALALLSEHRPDLVLCDVMLGGDPKLDGYSIHQHIRQHRSDLATTPFIFLTALGHRSNLLQARREGIDDCLIKPVDYDMLLATISSRLAQVARLRSHRRRANDSLLGRMQEVFAQLPGAVILCDPQGRLHYANHMAHTLSQEQDLWRANAQGQLSWPSLSSASLQQLQRCFLDIASAESGARRVQALDLRLGGESVLVSMLKLDAGDDDLEQAASESLLALFICSAQSRPLPDLESLRLLFGLTRTEARVALLLAKGLRTEEVAGELGVSNSTVAFHLRNLFSKTGVTRQTDIVALVLAAGWSIPDISRTAGAE